MDVVVVLTNLVDTIVLCSVLKMTECLETVMFKGPRVIHFLYHSKDDCFGRRDEMGKRPLLVAGSMKLWSRWAARFPFPNRLDI